MNTVILYKSVLGSTKKYAEWLAKGIKADLYKFNDITREELEQYDLVIVASGTYAAHMPLVNFIKKYWTILNDKKVIVLAVGMAPADDPQTKKAYESIPEGIRKRITYFKLPGKLVAAGPDGEPSPEKLEPVVERIRSLGVE